MADIEQGDYFVVRKGCKIGGHSYPSLFGGGMVKVKEGNDCSYAGMIFLANEVCPPFVSAAFVVGDLHDHWKLDESHMFNCDDVELWPVTKQFAESLGLQEQDA